jgi:desulfoferrodoxin (superoxide reductase-like protein)
VSRKVFLQTAFLLIEIDLSSFKNLNAGRRKEMNRMRIGMVVATLLLSLVTFAGSARADKPVVTVEAPDQVAKGTEIIIKVHVTHNENTFLHYVSWLRVRVNGEEIKDWEYSIDHRPEGARFTKDIRLVIRETSEIEAEANCSLHGSKGPGKKTITVTPSAK